MLYVRLTNTNILMNVHYRNKFIVYMEKVLQFTKEMPYILNNPKKFDGHKMYF